MSTLKEDYKKVLEIFNHPLTFLYYSYNREKVLRAFLFRIYKAAYNKALDDFKHTIQKNNPHKNMIDSYSIYRTLRILRKE